MGRCGDLFSRCDLSVQGRKGRVRRRCPCASSASSQTFAGIRSGSLVPYGHRAPQVQSYIQSLGSARAWRKVQSAKRKIQFRPCDVTKAPRFGREAQGICASLSSFFLQPLVPGEGRSRGNLESKRYLRRRVIIFLGGAL